MSTFDPVARARSYRERMEGSQGAERRLRDALAAGDGSPLVAGQTDEQYLQTVETLPEATADQIGRLLYQRRENANDILYLCIATDAGTPTWVAVSELNETADEVGLWKWTVYQSSLDDVYGVALTATPEVLVVENGTTVRRRNATTGASIGTFGSSGTGNGQFTGARGIAVSAAGNIHVADNLQNRVVQFNSSRTFVRNIGSSGTGNGQLSGPTGVACDSSNNVYVADTGNDRVAVFNSTGTWQRNIGTAGTGAGQLSQPVGVAVSGTELYVTDAALHKVVVYTASTGAYLREFGTFGSGSGQYNGPQGIAADADGDLYIADAGNARLIKATNTGSTMAVIGNTGSILPSMSNAALCYGVAVTGSEVYISASYSNGRYRPATKRYTVVPAGGVEVSANSGATASARAKLNFIGGTGVAVTVADDTTNLEADITLDAFPMRVVLALTLDNDFNSAIWLNMPAAETALFGYSGFSWAVPVDLSRATEARVIVRSSAATSGATIRIKYATTGTGASQTYSALASSGNVSATLSTQTAYNEVTIGSWTAIASGAKIDPCFLAPFGAGGNGTNDPAIHYVAVEFR